MRDASAHMDVRIATLGQARPAIGGSERHIPPGGLNPTGDHLTPAIEFYPAPRSCVIGEVTATTANAYIGCGSILESVEATVQERETNRRPRPYMQAKLVHTQAVVHGLVLNDLAEVARAADDLRATNQLSPDDAGADLLDDKVYRHFQLEFVRLSTRLGELARNENREGAALADSKLTANCMA